ncbi:MAG: substrate-binding domain-containing protein [Candidatus Amulumruptor caecigallinarius]|nr:substrate-binding domain-containing protein [Candidatus Amulumruptor caecigallinarius]MCM1397741.1 substrate-binding domain-containing protein [Candidatus Amulumruptor caecigallinarius]MCM1453176.1 substrate-binding domain-containing protein [bacterium]
MNRDKLIRLSVTVAFAAAILMSLAGCHRDKVYRIGVSQCSDDDWRQKMNAEIRREILFHPDAMVEIRSADDDSRRQADDIRYFKDAGFDILIVAPNEADALTPIIKEVYDGGMPVIVFDRDIHGESYTAWQGADNAGMGRAAAETARRLAGSGSKAIEIYGLPGSTPATERHAGFADRAAEEGIEVVASAPGNWNGPDAARVADSMLRAHPEASLIYAHNDRMAIAAARAARSMGRDMKVIGIDAAPSIGIKAVRDSIIDATFIYPTEGHRLVRTALAILKGTPFERTSRLPLSSAVDKSNADLLMLQDDQLREETSRIELLKRQLDDYWSRHSEQTALLYATIAIALLVCGLLFMLLRAYWQRKRHQEELMAQNRVLEQQRQAEQELNRRLSEATQSKLMFFTNVSHDLRTPLTLIAEPVEQLAAAPNLTPGQLTLMRIAAKNVKILRRLINQILDFRKYENDKLELNRVEVSPMALVTDWLETFSGIMRRRTLRLLTVMDVTPEQSVAIDVEKVERVFFNLMSNAIKYTPDNGTIRVTCRMRPGALIIMVEDNGKGMTRDEMARIFDRFYQVDRVSPNGSGIGLAVAKAFVELHGGTIDVGSETGVGTRFTVTIPENHVGAQAAPVPPRLSPAEAEVELSRVEGADTPPEGDAPLMLVIDDNPDIRLMLRELLSDEYRVIEAADGRDGLRLAAKYVPDIVVCDVMMPVMDGLECCRLIKQEMSTSHIPVLLLTACSLDEQRISGYDSGADGYLAKPFDERMLRAKCRSLLDNRKRIRALWEQSAGPRPAAARPATTTAATDIDSEFYARFVALVKEEMGNADLNIDALAARLNLGRSQFYRKIKALTNYSPVELLRKLRLERARELLTSTSRSVSEIAYEVGFSAPAYFTRVYRETYGETPTELRDRLGMSGR